MANRLFACLVALTFVLAPGARAFAKVRTVRGQLVDKVCYLQDQKANAGDSHPGMAADCATTCAQKGSAVALVTADGTLYEITGGLAAKNNAKLVPNIAHTVEIVGDVTVKYGELMVAANDLKLTKKAPAAARRN